MRLGAGFLLVAAAVSQPRPQVTSYIVTIDADGRNERVVHSSPRLFEAPNWSPDGKYLLLNSEGRLWRLPLDGGEPQAVDTGAVRGVNNDHGISPDGRWFAISAGQIYTAPASGGEPRQVTERTPSYFHGWSPDGKTLVYCAQRDGNFDLYAIPAAGGPETRLTSSPGYDDARITLPTGSGSTSIRTAPGRGISGASRPQGPGRRTPKPSASRATNWKTGFRIRRPMAAGSFSCLLRRGRKVIRRTAMCFCA